MNSRKALIIRFSSFGDVLQCFPSAQVLKEQGFDEILWVTRSDFVNVIKLNNSVSEVIGFKRDSGVLGLVQLAIELRARQIDLIYDAHNNVRSHILCFVLKPLFWKGPQIVRRGKHRISRFLQFRFGINLFGPPVRGQKTFLEPLMAKTNYQLKVQSPTTPKTSGHIVLVPGASWQLKVWPLQHWVQLIELFPLEKFVILGGANDKICFDIKERFKNDDRVINWAGQYSYVENIEIMAKCRAVVAVDTGLMHAADLLRVSTIALIGPSAFGYPSSPTSVTVETQLWCKPCSKDGRDRCRNLQNQKCLQELKPQRVQSALLGLLA